ncbi:hypothetical protein ABT001_08170 [Streptomyces sp. NPDC002793]|uniref:hypothetical protein n=1 Tax=Streptomyces sp. NPDC002793 TaxID=3154432 RepID=UPI003328727C
MPRVNTTPIMTSTPPPTPITPAHPTTPARTGRLRRWAHAQRRAAAGHFVRGLCYGAGVLTASLAGLWFQQYL